MRPKSGGAGVAGQSIRRAVNLTRALARTFLFGELAPATAERIRQTRPWRRPVLPVKPSIRIPLLGRDIAERCSSRDRPPNFESLDHIQQRLNVPRAAWDASRQWRAHSSVRRRGTKF